MRLIQILQTWHELDPERCNPERDGFWIGKEGQRLFIRATDPEVFDLAALHFQVQQAICDRGWSFCLTSKAGKCSAKVWDFEETTEFWADKDPTKALLKAFVSVLQFAATDQDWDKEEELKPLNITAPADWNEYNQYLLDGGQLEYEDWKAQKGAIACNKQLCNDGGDRK